MSTIIPINVPYILEATPIDKSGNLASGLSITYEVRKSSGDTLVFSGSLTEQPSGAYTASVTFTVSDQYRVFYLSPSDYENGCEKVLAEDADLTNIKNLLDTILDKVCKVLGLTQSNYKFVNQVYNGDGCLTSADIYIYPTALDLASDSNRIASYKLTAVYDSEGLLIDYTVVEV